jgi:hypothetical protein
MVVSRTVINAMIAAGVLCAGVGPAPAAADQTPDGAVASNPDGVKDGRRRGPQPTRPTNDGPGGQPGEHHCPWWPIPIPIPPARPPVTARNSLIGVDIALAPVVPVPHLAVAAPQAAQAEPVAIDFAVPSVVPPAAQSTPQGPPAASAISARTPVAPGPVVRPPRPHAPAAPVSLLPSPAATGAAPPPAAPVVEPADAPRLGYPDELRNADISRIAALALPGLAAIAGMTALGGLLGYRQAKASYVLRAAGAGRFLAGGAGGVG